MSLEQIIKDNTAALVALTTAMLNQNAAVAGTPAAPVTPKPNTPAPDASGAPTYEAVAKVVTDFLKANGRAAAVILLEPFKVTSIVSFKEKPAELTQIMAIFTDPAKTAAAIARAKTEAAAKPA